VISRDDITGLLLAGGRGSRMGGVDKGLQLHRGRTLAEHALERLRPQVGSLAISANRHLARYQAFGLPVFEDAPAPEGAGPLAGLLAGITHAKTPYVACVPCDAPNFPLDLVARLASAIHSEVADVAMAMDHERHHPVFCLVATRLRADLESYLDEGGRRMMAWLQRHRCAEARFDDARAFANANTLADLTRLESGAFDAER
jgi:molybdopterin-guanine dinucleotide biosynthesis protein A